MFFIPRYLFFEYLTKLAKLDRRDLEESRSTKYNFYIRPDNNQRFQISNTHTHAVGRINSRLVIQH